MTNKDLTAEPPLAAADAWNNSGEIYTLRALSPPIVSFTGPGGKTIGRLEIKDGALTFEGNADASAKQFFEFLISSFGAWNSVPTKRAYRRYTDVSNCAGVELEWTDEGVAVTPFALGVYSGHWNIRTITINQGKTDDFYD